MSKERLNQIRHWVEYITDDKLYKTSVCIYDTGYMCSWDKLTVNQITYGITYGIQDIIKWTSASALPLAILKCCKLYKTYVT